MADFYAVLCIERSATDEEIKQSYRRLAMQYHPDKNAGSKESEEKFKEISEAYDVLRDAQKRAAYDRYGEAGLRGSGGGGGGFHHVDLSEALNIFMRDFGLGDIFGGGQRQQAGPRSGADLKIVSDNVLTIAEFAWLVKKDSPIKTIKDLKGKKIGYTNPRSTSQALDILMLAKAGLKPEDAELVKTGGFGPMVAALALGQIDCAPVTEPLWSKEKNNYRVLITGAEALPPLDNVVGMATGEAMRTRGDFIRAVIRARRRAVEFMIAHPDEAGDIVAKPFNITPEVARSAVRNLTTSMTEGVPYWGPGDFHLAGMKRIIEVQKSVGAITGDIDLSKIITTEFLPDDLKKIK